VRETVGRRVSWCHRSATAAGLARRIGCDHQEWVRGKVCAFAQSMGMVWYNVTSNPTVAAVGRRTLDRIVADRP
jgi:hypothetical protein